MRYAVSIPVGYFSAQIRAEFATKKIVGNVLMFLTRAMTTRPNVFMEVEHYDAVITARDNRQNEIDKLLALQAAV